MFIYFIIFCCCHTQMKKKQKNATSLSYTTIFSYPYWMRLLWLWKYIYIKVIDIDRINLICNVRWRVYKWGGAPSNATLNDHTPAFPYACHKHEWWFTFFGRYEDGHDLLLPLQHTLGTYCVRWPNAMDTRKQKYSFIQIHKVSSYWVCTIHPLRSHTFHLFFFSRKPFWTIFLQIVVCELFCSFCLSAESMRAIRHSFTFHLSTWCACVKSLTAQWKRWSDILFAHSYPISIWLRTVVTWKAIYWWDLWYNHFVHAEKKMGWMLVVECCAHTILW